MPPTPDIVSCPSCSQRFTIRHEFIGKLAKCTKCDVTFSIRPTNHHGARREQAPAAAPAVSHSPSVLSWLALLLSIVAVGVSVAALLLSRQQVSRQQQLVANGDNRPHNTGQAEPRGAPQRSEPLTAASQTEVKLMAGTLVDADTAPLTVGMRDQDRYIEITNIGDDDITVHKVTLNGKYSIDLPSDYDWAQTNILATGEMMMMMTPYMMDGLDNGYNPYTNLPIDVVLETSTGTFTFSF